METEYIETSSEQVAGSNLGYKYRKFLFNSTKFQLLALVIYPIIKIKKDSLNFPLSKIKEGGGHKGGGTGRGKGMPNLREYKITNLYDILQILQVCTLLI